jgi:hypothetical protein
MEMMGRIQQKHYDERPNLKAFRDRGYVKSPDLTDEQNKEVEVLLTKLVLETDKLRIEITSECVEKETEKVEAQKNKLENLVRDMDSRLKGYYPSYRY